MSLSVIMPAFNEEERIGSVIDEIRNELGKTLDELVVVDDGSNDRTAEIAHAHGAIVYRIRKNAGYGRAIKVGIQRAKSEYAITVDADGQHDPLDVLKLYHLRESADLLVGDRGNLASSGLWRGLGKFALWKLAEYLTRQEIKDLNSGMKLGRTSDLKILSRLCPDGMSFSDTLTLIYMSKGTSVRFVPIRTRKRKSGKSTIGLHTATETALSIVNVIMLFNPVRIFFPISFSLVLLGLLWATPIALAGRGLSVGGLLLILVGVLTSFFGVSAEQVSQLRKEFIAGTEFLTVDEWHSNLQNKNP